MIRHSLTGTTYYRGAVGIMLVYDIRQSLTTFLKLKLKLKG